MAAEAKAILQRYGIGINDAANGVFLPTQKGVSNSAYHPSLYTNVYYDEVNRQLQSAASRDEVIDILLDIRQELLNGTFVK